ncbi:type II toxin-antitoxin system VapC family toxin [Parerythrobacter lacustris]|uniref:Ribonuclease VapC n=1 Tax=Parerythrobacter lacustris TaxID=2969984 RepID=A0ABT1XLN5_9SPHN|nr:type II toxin-antitoxin system VapC family toxin [Parerythrobacter lacustris]MCR2832570.1 type II toxin-antitoxin system VapC family toxin [Parerythrobacter lacustris]
MNTPVAGVLDASALLAVVLREIDDQQAERWLHRASMSAVNLSEVVARLSDLDYAPDMIADGLAEFDLDIHPFDAAQAERAGRLRAATRHRGLSLGDRACLALAAELGRPAITADRAWAEFDLGISIEVIR